MKPVIVNGNVDQVTKDDLADLIKSFKRENAGKRIKIAGPVIERALESADYEDFEIDFSESFKEIKLEVKV
ncbi:hypothetical protein [Halanaerobium salsuginis]|uniref:Uncharacterized protein n=1 Tax=Halanaerobium salsuginis TaxID=29563 RepID=A0A1I4EVT8_9FIRM|nr:hypothetical protein [Halanaerobium salsuginis]SFL09865.1 hypothetical protein SAMN02983006_00178 [Halanaerobium salsuginis]